MDIDKNVYKDMITQEDIMKKFIAEWFANGYCGSFKYIVIANNFDKAKEIWNEFISNNDKLAYSWEKAERGVKNHYGGFIRWKEIEISDKQIGCYKMEFDDWNTGSDHLWD